MKNWLKFTLVVICIIILTIIIDLIYVFTINRPIFSQGEDYGTHAIYKGLFFNTYKNTFIVFKSSSALIELYILK